jgi:hypothetical protein
MGIWESVVGFAFVFRVFVMLCGTSKRGEVCSFFLV